MSQLENKGSLLAQGVQRIRLIDEYGDIADRATTKAPAVTLPLHEQPTEKVRLVQPDVFSLYDWRIVQDFAREDGVSPRLFVTRLLTVEYHRRLIARDVAALEGMEAR